MANEITLPVKLQLDNLQSIMKEMRSQLGTLKVDSSGYKKLEGVINGIEKRIQDIQVIASRPIMDGKQFVAIEKDVAHIYDDITKLGIEAGRIKFSDLQLTGEQKQRLQEFDNQLKTIKDDLKNIEQKAKTAFLSTDAGKLWAEQNPSDATKSFSRITEIIELEVAKQKKAINDAKDAYADYQNTIQISKNINSFMRGKNSLTDRIKAAGMYDQIFNVKGNFKNGGRNALEDWLKSEFSLSDEAIKSITQGSGQQVLKAFTEMQDNVRAVLKSEQSRMSAERKTALETTNNGKTLTDKIANEEAKQQSVAAVHGAVVQAIEARSQAEAQLRQEEKLTQEERSNYISGLTNQARAQLQMGNSCDQAKAQLASLNNTVKEGQAKLASLDQATSKLQGISNFVNRYVGAYAIIRKVSTAIRNAFNNIKELDKTITDIAVVTNMSQEDLWNKVGQYTQMAQEYGVTTNDVYKVSQLFYQQGLQTSQVMSLTTETLKMAKIAGMGYTEATNAMTVAVRAFNIEMSQAQQVTDTYSALAAKFAVSSQEIANAMEKTASSAANVGMSLQSTSAFMSVMIQTTRESAQNIGSALKSIISRYGEMKASPDKLLNVDGEEVAFNKVDTALASIGISIKDATGQFRDFDDVIMELAAKWNTLDNNTQRYIATIMAGNRQQSRFIALVSNYGELSRAMDVANNAENASIVQVAKTMDSLESKTNQLKNAFSQLYLDLHIESGLKNIYDWLTRIITTVGKLGTLKGAIPTLMNIFGFGAGLKSTIKSISDNIQTKKLKIETDNSEYQREIERINNDLSKTYDLNIKTNVDDTQLQTAKNEMIALQAQSLTTQMTGINDRLNSSIIMTDLITNQKNLSNADYAKNFLEDRGFNDTEIEQLLPVIQAFGRLGQAAEEASNKVQQFGDSTDRNISATDHDTQTKQQSSMAEEEKVIHARNAGQADEDKVSPARRAAAADEEKANKAGNRGKGWSGHETAMKITGIAAGAARMIGTAVLATGASIQDQSTDSIERSKIWTGVGNGLSMAGTGASMLMGLGPWGAAAGAIGGFLIGGIGAIIDGLHMSLEERLELEKKEAKEKSDAALKEQAKATDISSSIDNIKQLQKAMYNSTEDMQAYKDAMNTLGQSYPELISTYDSMGNAIIDLQQAESVLMNVRSDAASAARKAAEAEMKTRVTQAKIWDEASVQMNNLLNNPASTGAYLGNKGTRTTLINGNLSEEEYWAPVLDVNNNDLQSNLQILANSLISTVAQGKLKTNEEVFNILENYRKNRGKIFSYDESRILMQYASRYNKDTNLWDKSVSLNGWNRDSFDSFLEMHPDILNNSTLLYGNVEELEKQLDEILQSQAESLNLDANITAREFFKWGGKRGEALSEAQLQSAQELLDLKVTGSKNSAKVLNSAVTRGYAEESLNDALRASDINSSRQLKFSTNAIFTNLIAQGLESAAQMATDGQMSASEWATNPETEAAFTEAKDNITKNLMEEIVNWSDKDIEKFLTATGDMTQYLNADDLFAAAGIEKTSTIASELEAAFIKDNETNRDRILKTIFTIDTEGEIDTSEINSIFSNLINEGFNEELIHSLGAQFDGISDNQIISKYADYFSTELLAINELANNGYTKLASTRLNILSALADALGEIDTSKEQQDLFATITSIDFTNYDSLLNAQKAIEQYRTKNNITDETDGTYQALQAIIDAQNSLIFNVNTLAQGLAETIENAAKEIDSVLGANKSGLDLSKALSVLTDLNVGRSLEDAFEFNEIFEYDAALNNYVYKAKGLQEAISKTEGELTKKADQLAAAAENYISKDTLEGLTQYKDFANTELSSKVELTSDDFLTYFRGLELSDTALILYQQLTEDFLNSDLPKTFESYIDYLIEQGETATKAKEIADQMEQAYKDNMKNQYFQNIDWAALELGTDYYGTNETLVDALADELKLEGYSTQTVFDKYLETIKNTDAREATRVKINDSIIQEKTSQYQNAISELLTYSTDKYLSQATKTAANRLNINLDNLKDNAENAIVVAQEFLNELAQQIGKAGYTLEQYNQDASSILERTLAGQTKGKALLDFVSEDTIGVSQLEGLANTLGLQLNQLVNVATGEVTGILTDHLTFNTNTGTYEIQGSFESFIDALNKKYGNVIDKTSQQYIDALKSFNERKINQHNKIEKAIVDSIVGIDKAKTGDWIDLTEVGVQLSNKLLEWTELDESGTESVHRKTALYALNEELFKYGAELSEGILKLSDDANLLGIASTLQSITGEAGLELKDGLEEIADAVQNVLQSYTNVIKNGISGGLSHVDAADLSTKAADLGINKLNFIETAEGLKLSQNSAIELYTKLKQIDSLQGKLVFDELNKSLQESNEHYKSISDIANRIAWIEDETHPERAEQYAEELALAKEIYAVRSTTEDSSFNFMSNSIPAAQNNPINYYNNWAKAIHTFNDALKTPGTYTKEGKSYKSGFVDYDYWYNLVTEMNNIAKLGGDIEFAGVTLDGSLERASELIQKGADSLVVTDAGEVKVALQGISVDFETGADVFSGNVTEGIQAMAKSQVKMLDGMIQLLETIVAMEKLGDITGGDNTIDLTDLFPEFTSDTDKQVLNNITGFNDFVKAAGDNLDTIVINGEKLSDTIKRAQTVGLNKAEAENFTAIMNSLYQMYQSGEYNLDNIYDSIQQIMAASDFSGTIQLGDQTLIIQKGTTILETKDGKYQAPNGQTYDNLGEAVARTAVERQGSTGDTTWDGKVAQKTVHIESLDLDVVIESNELGEVTFNDGTFNSLDEYIQYHIDNDSSLTKEQKIQKKIDVGLELGTVKLDSFTYNSIDDIIKQELEGALASGQQAKVDAVIEAHPVLNQLKGQTGEEISKLLGLDSIKTTVDNSQALDAINAVEEALGNLKDKTITITTIEKTVSDNTSSGGGTSDTSLSRPRAEKTLAAHAATGNIGLARSKGTLMGELGPELVVSNGRYFVAGQNGPEMINLADDAIVFNHLQTKSLLEKGMSSGRGKAVTNERNAVSFATGNVNGGPAMASASAALAALKQLRAQWQALAGLSAQDLAGKGGGGGGGGGGDPKAFVKELEKWYNWLQEIAQLEKEITLEESKRQKYQSSMIAMGREYAASQLDTLKKLKQQSAVQLSLNRAQSAYFEKRRKDLNENSAFKALYQFDENGQLKYKDGKLEQLSDLVGRDAVTGQANYTAKEQYEKLVEMGYAEQMMYDSSGNEIKQEGDDWYNTAIQAFWDKIEAEREEMQSLHDDVLDGENKLYELSAEQNQILHEIEDNQITVEQKVLKAIEDIRQQQIDDLQDEKDAIEKSSKSLIDGLSNQLQKEQDMRSKQQNSDELTTLQRRLAILQRSGGSAAQIASLQKEISSKQEDAYFDAQQAQIDALQEATDNQLEKLQQQIDLMTEQLAYEKENGLLWQQVYEVMAKSPEEITSLIMENTKEYFGKSPTELAKETRDTLVEAQKFVEYREQVTGGLQELIDQNSDEAISELSDEITAEADAASAAEGASDTNISNTNTSTGTTAGSSEVTGYYYKSVNAQQHQLMAMYADGSQKAVGGLENHTFSGNKCTKCYYEQVKKKIGGGGGSSGMYFANSKESSVPMASGGLVTHPTYALIGETGKPEAVLNPEQTAILRNDILSNKPTSLLSLLTDFRDAYNSIPNASSYSSIGTSNGVVIENATVEMNVARIDNDYDAQRAGEQALDRMLQIARKTQGSNRIGR